MTEHEAYMLNALLELEDGLTDWEVEFIESLSNQNRPLSQKQHDKLESIYERLC